MYNLQFTEDIELYFDKLYQYLKFHDYDVNYVNKVKKEFLEKARRLEEFPYSCQVFRNTNFRCLLVDHKHKFLFQVYEETKTIVFISAYNEKQQIYQI